MLRATLFGVCVLLALQSDSLSFAIEPSQQMRSFGNKMVEGTWHQKLPKEQQGKHTYKWALGHQYLLVHQWHADKPNALSVVGIDPTSNLQTWWTFSDDGKVAITSVDVETLSSNEDRVTLAGNVANATGTFGVSWPDANTIAVDPGADAKHADGTKAIAERWERSKEADDLTWLNANAPTKVPSEFEYLKSVTGKCWIDGKMQEGTKIAGASFGKWILDGQFFLFSASTVGEDQTTWSHIVISGNDPETDEPAEWEFTSDGAKSYVTLSKDGKTIYGANTRSNGDVYRFEGQFTMDGDTLRYNSAIGQKGETPLPYNWNYRRAK